MTSQLEVLQQPMMHAVIDALLIMYNLIIAGIANDCKFSCPSGYIDSNVANVQGDMF